MLMDTTHVKNLYNNFLKIGTFVLHRGVRDLIYKYRLLKDFRICFPVKKINKKH